MLRALLLCLLLCSSEVCGRVSDNGPSRFEIETITVWHEARGEPLFVQQLVLDVLRNRAYNSNKSLLEVVSESGQFPWRQQVKTWKLTQEQAEFGFRLLQYSDPVRSNFLYFNTIKHDFGKKTKKFGRLYFSV